MSDFLVELGKKDWLRKGVQSAGLPLPMPQDLARGRGGWMQDDLRGKTVLTGGRSARDIDETLNAAGASAAGSEGKVHALLFDGRDIVDLDGLRELYQFVHSNIRRLDLCGRVVVVANAPQSAKTAEAAAAANACSGFVKSVAKEIGKKGAIANLLFVEAGADAALSGPLRFFLSARSAFVDGQVVSISKSSSGIKPTWSQQLKGKTAVVTGGARGIGAATAQRLADEGAKVIVLDIPQAEQELRAFAQSIDGVPLALDITREGAASTILQAGDAHGGLDIVVNNAGVTRDKTIANMSGQFWDMAIDVNLRAALEISEKMLKHAKDGARVVCLSSIAGIAGNFGQTNYGAAKSGLIGAVHNLAPKFAKKSATINAIAPGFIETQMTAAIPFVTREGGRRLSNLGQGGQPIDVAEAITFLATPGAAGVNGQIIRVCGGSLIGA